jgi:hypothetical protein
VPCSELTDLLFELPSEFRRTLVKTRILTIALLGLIAHWASADWHAVHAATINQASPYLSFADSPFSSTNFSGGYFYLEDFIGDPANGTTINSPGVSETGGIFSTNGGNDSSVDGDDGAIDGIGLLAGGYAQALVFGVPSEFVFDANVLGSLPTHVGLVFTHSGGATLEAFDQNGISLGTTSAPLSPSGNVHTVGDEVFLGATNAGGISKFRLTGQASWIDHVQYGVVPEPSSLALMGCGIAGLGALVWRRRARLRSS